MRSAASFLILVIYCLSIGAYDALAYEADEKAVRKLLTLEDPSKNWQLKKAARKFLRGLSKQQARATLESVVKSGKCSQAGKVEYLHLADGLGASTTFWDTALDIVRNGNTKLQQKAMSAISNYLGRNKSAHADRRKSMIAALWALLKNEQMEQKSKILGVLMRLDSKQATAHLLQGFGAQKWPENERYGMVSMLRSSTGVPRKRKLEILIRRNERRTVYDVSQERAQSIG